MNERDLVVLEQYPFTVKQTYRGRGSYICVTDRGLMRLQEYGGGEKRARLMQQLQQHIREKGYRVQDVPVANGEGNVVSMGMDGRKYIVT